MLFLRQIDPVHVNLLTLLQGHNGSQTSSRYSSRHSSIEPSYASSAAFGNDPRELKRLLTQLEEKYREVLVINAQLDCEKQFLKWVQLHIVIKVYRIKFPISFFLCQLLASVHWYCQTFFCEMSFFASLCSCSWLFSMQLLNCKIG